MSSFISFSQSFFETLYTWIFPILFKILLIIGIAFLAQYLIDLASGKLKFTNENGNESKQSRRFTRIKTINQIIRSTSRVIIITIGLIMILNELGLDTRPLLASAGILGVAFGLGAQNIMKDVINGFLILSEDQFGIGDTVKIGEIAGKVENMNLRITTLKDASGNVHVIPNSEIKQVTVLK